MSVIFTFFVSLKKSTVNSRWSTVVSLWLILNTKKNCGLRTIDHGIKKTIQQNKNPNESSSL